MPGHRIDTGQPKATQEEHMTNEELILRLQLEDIREMKNSGKGKGREGELSDAEFAMQIYLEEINRANLLNSDKRMAQSIASAITTDGALVNQNAEEEAQAARDRQYASAMESGMPIKAKSNKIARRKKEIVSDEVIEKLSFLYNNMSPNDDQHDNHVHVARATAESSSAAMDKPLSVNHTDRPCAACREDKKFFDLARLPCGDEYCSDCLNELFRLAAVDESLFPARCCRQVIPIEGSVRLSLRYDVFKRYSEASIEFGTPNRVYCRVQECSAFIPPSVIAGNETVSCPKCNEVTCTLCRGAPHRGDCPEDTRLQEILEIARERGWQRCYNCQRLVELGFGCNHMR
jgi:hypothetical protein